MTARILAHRRARLRERMASGKIAALLVTQREHVRYLTGFTGSAGIALITPRGLFLITDFRYQLQARREAPGALVVIQTTDIVSALRDTAARARTRVLWYDEASLTVDRMKAIRRKGIMLKGTIDHVARLRQIKDAGELRCIRRAIRRAEESFLELKRTIRPGQTERELALRLELLMRDKGARKPAFDIIVASGRNGAMPHASVTTRRLQRGDLVTIDFGAEADGYFCDITRTFCIGRPTRRQREVHELVMKAQEAAINKVRPGVPCREIDAAARTVITESGQGERFGHGTGHGIGLVVHEGPSLSRLSRDTVEEGMVFTVEPGVYIPGWGGVRIEDMLLVTRNGAKRITSLPREL